MGASPSILVVAAERQTRESLRACLADEHHVVREADSGERALAEIAVSRPALLLLDLHGLRAEGFELCMRIRSSDATRSLPVLMVGQRDGELDRVLGLELGVDGFVTDPFTPRELVAHVRAILRRQPPRGGSPHEVFERGRLRIDFDACEVTIDGDRIEVTLRDFELLKFFVHHPHRVYRRHELLDLVWGKNAGVELRTVDAHILRLRKQLERRGTAGRLFITVRGVGYRFNPDSLDEPGRPAPRRAGS